MLFFLHIFFLKEKFVSLCNLIFWSFRIQVLNEYDFQRNRRESALNALESYVFDAQNKLEEEDYQSAATSEEMDKIRQGCSEVGSPCLTLCSCICPFRPDNVRRIDTTQLPLGNIRTFGH